MQQQKRYSPRSPRRSLRLAAQAACRAGCRDEGGADVKMCNARVTCQRRHRPCHKKELKQRAARLHEDESLFKQPPPKEDCPICFLPMPFAPLDMAIRYPCCGKIVCRGCIYSSYILSRNLKCAFCNANIQKLYKNDDISMELLKKRVEADDVNSITRLGSAYALGSLGLQQDHNKAFELYTRAAELGSSMAHYQIGWVYEDGLGVEKDLKKAIHHYEVAAMAGYETARFALGAIEYKSGNLERAMKHLIISASAGHKDSMSIIKRRFEKGCVKSDVYELTLKDYSDSCDAMRSKSREDAGNLAKTMR
jgi:TPR repeat protein